MASLAQARYDDRPTAASFRIGVVTIFASAANDNGAYDYTPPTANVTYAGANALNQYPSVNSYPYTYWPEGGLKETDTLAANYDELGTMIEGFTTVTPGVIDPAHGVYVGVDALGHKYFHEAQTVAGQPYPFVYHSTDGLRPETVLEWVYQGLNGAPQTLQGIRRYVLGPDPDERWAYIGPNGGTYNPHTDREGTLIALANGGQVAHIYTWDAYGQNTAPASDTGPGATGYLYRYTGQRLDPNTGLYDYKARDYSPTLGRFLQPDPAGLDQGPNLYEYVGDEPVGAGDPSGMGCDPILPCTTSIGPAHDAGAKSDNARNGSQGKSNASPAFLSPATAAAINDVGTVAKGVAQIAATIGAASVGGLALSLIPTNTADKTQDEAPRTINHYTTDAGRTGILESGGIRPSADGYVYLTPNKFVNGENAQAGLATRSRPTGYFSIPMGNVRSIERAGVVQPANGQPGGAWEMLAPHPVSVEGAVWVPIGP